jgi:hypothetical protein
VHLKASFSLLVIFSVIGLQGQNLVVNGTPNMLHNTLTTLYERDPRKPIEEANLFPNEENLWENPWLQTFCSHYFSIKITS